MRLARTAAGAADGLYQRRREAIASSETSFIGRTGALGEFELEFAAVEVKQLSWFLDGAIMEPASRRRLRRNWGLCPRHGWGLAIVECECRGGAVFVTTILYEDLARLAARATRESLLTRAARTRRLQAEGSCPTCEYAALAHDDPAWMARTRAVNQLGRFRALFAASRPEVDWRSCPACLGGTGLLCRRHLLAGAKPRDDVSEGLCELAGRLHALRKSMTADGRPADARQRAAWIEVLGWFCGWDLAGRVSA
jgi:hypothetical protein